MLACALYAVVVCVRPFVYQYPVNVAWLRLRKQGHRKE